MTFDPDAPFILTGQPEPTEQEHVQFLSNAAFPDQRLARLFGDCVNALISAIRYARAQSTASMPEESALQQLTIATGAIAASEAEALLTLVTAGVSSSARIHLRALGECDLRLRAYAADRGFALRVYRSLIASQKEAVRHLDDEVVHEQIDELFKAATETSSDRKLTGALLNNAEQAAAILQKHEWHAWSKWSHAEIIALGEVANRINQRPTWPIQRAITDDSKWLFCVSRGMLFLLAILVAFQIIGIDVRSIFTGINEQFIAIAQEYGILDAQKL